MEKIYNVQVIETETLELMNKSMHDIVSAVGWQPFGPTQVAMAGDPDGQICCVYVQTFVQYAP